MIKLSFYKKLEGFFGKIGRDAVNTYAAQASFFIIVSFFPFLMFLITLMKQLNITEDAIKYVTLSFVPTAVNDFFLETFNEISHKSSGAVISITAITTLWSSSKAALAIMSGFNSVYEIKEKRNFLKVRVAALFYTFFFAVLIIVTLGILVFGNSIIIWLGYKFPAVHPIAVKIRSARTVGAFVILSITFIILFFTVARKRMKLLPQIPGAIIAAGSWIGFSYLYSYYIDNIGNFSYIYGSLTAVVLCMLWLYFCMFFMFLGAELNAQIFLPKYENRIETKSQIDVL